MIYLVCKKDSDFFTKGKAYRAIDSMSDGGYLAYNNFNQRDYMSAGFVNNNFNVYNAVSVFECVEYINGFTVGKCYPVLEWVEGGATVVNDEGFENWLSGLYGLAKFKEV